jgi:hypothetical protein
MRAKTTWRCPAPTIPSGFPRTANRVTIAAWIASAHPRAPRLSSCAAARRGAGWCAKVASTADRLPSCRSSSDGGPTHRVTSSGDQHAARVAAARGPCCSTRAGRGCTSGSSRSRPNEPCAFRAPNLSRCSAGVSTHGQPTSGFEHFLPDTRATTSVADPEGEVHFINMAPYKRTHKADQVFSVLYAIQRR